MNATITSMVALASKMPSSASISPCEQYRYSLHRTWDPSKPRVLFVMLNPSTADTFVDDATVRKNIGFARRWQFGGLDVGNLYAWRATDPDELLVPRRDVVGRENDDAIRAMAARADRIICAWGSHKAARLPFTRAKTVLNVLRPFAEKCFALKLSKDGHPWHPLYIRYDIELVPFARAS